LDQGKTTAFLCFYFVRFGSFFDLPARSREVRLARRAAPVGLIAYVQKVPTADLAAANT
jgi:hypothetical protein